MGLNGDKLVLGIENEGKDEIDEVEEEEVKCELDMRGEGIWRNDQSRVLHRRGSWIDGHRLSRYIVRGKEERGK